MKSLFLAIPFLLAAASPACAAGDPAAGKAVFQRCAACHSITPGARSLGPNLHGVVGRGAGKLPGFSYSPAMAKLSAKWTPAQLDKFLAHPQATVPGTRMASPGVPDAKERADVIAYLETLK